MNHGMVYQVVLKVVELLKGWEFTIDEKTSGFDKGTFLGDLLDGIAPVQQDPFFSIQIGDLALTGPCAHIPRIKSNQSCGIPQRGNVYSFFSAGTL